MILDGARPLSVTATSGEWRKRKIVEKKKQYEGRKPRLSHGNQVMGIIFIARSRHPGTYVESNLELRRCTALVKSVFFERPLAYNLSLVIISFHSARMHGRPAI